MSFEPPLDDSYLRDDYDEIDAISDEMRDVYDSIIDRLDEYERAALSQDIVTFTYLYRKRMQEAQYE